MNISARTLSSRMLSNVRRASCAGFSHPFLQISRSLCSGNVSSPTTFLPSRASSISTGNGYVGKSLTKIALKIPYIKRNIIKTQMIVAARKLYMCTLQYIDFEEFVKSFDLEDSFASWAFIVQLHAWMLMVRLNRPKLTGENNMFSVLRTEFNKSMWIDVEQRAKKISNNNKYKKGFYALGDHYISSSLALTDGLSTDDEQLANALSKHILQSNKEVRPSQILHLLGYVRRNLKHLESIADEPLLGGYVTYMSLGCDKTDPVKDKQVLEYIQRFDSDS